jgi:transcription-repair coupling factor (superfamily II helicase)
MSHLYKQLSALQKRLPAFASIRASLEGNKKVWLKDLPASLDAYLAAWLHAEMKRPLMLIADTETEAERLYDDIVKFTDEESVALLAKTPKASAVKQALNKHLAEHEVHAELLEALEKIARSTEPLVIISTAESVTIPVPSKEMLRKDSLSLKRGEATGFDTFIAWLKDSRFDQKQFVEISGDFAVRGGIVDVFPYTDTVPIRIEFFGDEIESIREFDIVSQRSIAHREEVHLVANVIGNTDLSGSANILEYLPENTIYIVKEPELIFPKMAENGGGSIAEKLKEGSNFFISQIPPPNAIVIACGAKKQLTFASNVKLIREYLHKVHAEEWSITILAESRDLLTRLEDLMEPEEAEKESEPGIDSEAETEEIQKGAVKYVVPSLSNGFIFEDLKIAILTEHELFGRRRGVGASRRKHSARTKGISLRELRSLRRGDLLVHEDKGIGKFSGLETIEVRGSKQEVVRLSYRDSDVLFVNLDYISKLSKYSATEVDETSVKLSKLGSAEWQRAKDRTKKRLKDIARNLIRLYAKRKRDKGYAYSPDDILQREMEAGFLYEDTPDQAKATDDVKKDMMLASPMDRLICGDVGYGKTEVAMRAAMKATVDKKQVAVLVPTTILAEQHFRSFGDRLEAFGVSVGCLSRFRSAKEQKEILAKLAEGKIDVLIGTHRILSKDVIFKDLGLLVVDEEHRFGVAAKEKLRELRANVDTLTLTATPIPRTLNFSLLGARDLSVIETPPKNRLPIATEILVDLDPHILGVAIRREMERGGQIYAINDKVKDIEIYAEKLRQIVPRIRVGVVHGQLSPAAIEKVMKEFLERKIDVLCATKIVESGLDVPNANTIVINHAHNFGLAELYQLRGRVGRSNEQAYCYLVTNPIHTLSRDSLKRLEAMEEFSELGAGFQLAMRDLEIRGAGNLLGAEQSGFINEIGFDLYQKTLTEAVDELKEEEFKGLFADGEQTQKAQNAFIRRKADDSEGISISLGTDALIPELYIEDDAERFNFYQRLASVTNEEELQEIYSELRDRFGNIPEEVENLLNVARTRLLAKKLGVRSVHFDEPTRTLRITLPKEDQEEYYRGFFPFMIDKFKVIGESKVRLINEKKGMRLVIKLSSQTETDRIKEILSLLRSLVPQNVETIAV